MTAVSNAGLAGKKRKRKSAEKKTKKKSKGITDNTASDEIPENLEEIYKEKIKELKAQIEAERNNEERNQNKLRTLRQAFAASDEIEVQGDFEIELLHPAIWLQVGKSKSGKSHMTRWLLTQYWAQGKFAFGVVFTPTKFNDTFDEFIENKTAIIAGYTDERFKKYLNILKRIKEETGEIPPNFIVFEDIVGAVQQDTHFFHAFISEYRHYNATIWINTQYLFEVTTILREQATHVTIFHQTAKRSILGLYEHFGLWFDSIFEFHAYMLRIHADKYRALLIRNDIPDFMVQERFLAFKAPELKEFEKIKIIF